MGSSVITNPTSYVSNCYDTLTGDDGNDKGGNDKGGKNWLEKKGIKLGSRFGGKVPEGINRALYDKLGHDEIQKMVARRAAIGFVGSLIGLSIGYYIHNLEPDKNIGDKRVLQAEAIKENGAKNNVKISQK